MTYIKKCIVIIRNSAKLTSLDFTLTGCSNFMSDTNEHVFHIIYVSLQIPIFFYVDFYFLLKKAHAVYVKEVSCF